MVDRRQGTRRRKKKKSGNKVFRNVVIGIEALVLVAVIVLLIFVFQATGDKKGISMIDIPEDKIIFNPVEPGKPGTDVTEVNNDYTTYAFFGVDARNGTLEKGTRTDTIIICTIDKETGEVRLCSVYRDTLLNIGTMDNPSYQKCNAAYAYGGPEKAINMLNQNLDLPIEKFITVGFDGVMKTVDAVNGVDIDIRQEEIKALNDYQASMYSTETNPNLTTDFTPVEHTGMQTLNGWQALAYCRIRYTQGGDFKRTERQRDVLTQIIAKAKKMDPSKAVKICNDVFPLVATNFKLEKDIIPMAEDIGNYEIVASSGFPFEDKVSTGMLGSKGDCVIPVDLVSNVEQLHEFLYPKVSDYTPSETVRTISSDIKAEAAKYGK